MRFKRPLRQRSNRTHLSRCECRSQRSESKAASQLTIQLRVNECLQCLPDIQVKNGLPGQESNSKYLGSKHAGGPSRDEAGGADRCGETGFRPYRRLGGTCMRKEEL